MIGGEWSVSVGRERSGERVECDSGASLECASGERVWCKSGEREECLSGERVEYESRAKVECVSGEREVSGERVGCVE